MSAIERGAAVGLSPVAYLAFGYLADRLDLDPVVPASGIVLALSPIHR